MKGSVLHSIIPHFWEDSSFVGSGIIQSKPTTFKFTIFSAFFKIGIKKLKDAGIEVQTDILSQKGEKINSHFFTFHRTKRPFITLKFATSKDQFLSQKNGAAVQFSNEMSKTLVHKLRTSHQAILVGANTANWDNPQLTNRLWKGNTPIRLVS